MTLERAIEILNWYGHGGHHDWYARGEFACVKDSTGDPLFTAFEAIAIAEKYDREN